MTLALELVGGAALVALLTALLHRLRLALRASWRAWRIQREIKAIQANDSEAWKRLVDHDRLYRRRQLDAAARLGRREDR